MNDQKMTIKKAKELAKESLGLPRCGYEFIIIDRPDYRLSLVNRSVKFSLFEWHKPQFTLR